MIKVLVVDDSALMRRVLGNIFNEEEGFEVEFARDGVEGLAKTHDFRPDVVTLDVNMPKMDGLACLDRIMLERPTRVVMVSSRTASGAEETLDAMNLGAVDFVAKPEGALSLIGGEFTATIVSTVRAAAKARLRLSHRLSERVRMKSASPAPRRERGQPDAIMPFGRGPLHSYAGNVVLVGTSTGGPPALDALLSPLPSNFPWPIVIAQHMPASFTGALARRLDKLCALSVQEVSDPVDLEPGNVYVGKGDADIIIMARADRLAVASTPSLAEHRWHPSVDRLVTTALQHIGADRITGILMTGMGDDGAVSMQRLNAQGGRTIAEAEETAIVWGMPGELVKRGGASVIAPVDKIAAQLADWARNE